MKKIISTFAFCILFFVAYSHDWTSWQSLDDGWEKNLKGRKQIINPFTEKFIQYEVKNDYKFLVFFTITFEWNTGETGTWEWNLEPGKTKNWIREATGIKKVTVIINKYKGADGEYYTVGEKINTLLGNFKLSYDAQVRLKDHFKLIESGSTLGKFFAASPFAFLFLGGKPEPEDIINFPWADFVNACKDLRGMIQNKLYDDAMQNCAQANEAADKRFWCRMAETYK